MSTKKEKLIEEAQRLTLKGQLDKAIKVYEQVLSFDSSAINQRQKLAELLVKVGRNDEARAAFELIGKYYSSNGFYLKAIAVYKQLQKLFSNDVSITLVLAGLNEKHGLVGNALAEYKQVYDYYEKNSSMEDALKILEKMQNVDPQNINIKLKLAESYFHVGKKDESYAAFGRLAVFLQERGDSAAVSKLNTRIQQLFPEKTEFVLEVLSEQVESGNAASAVPGIQALLRSNPHNKRIWDLIVAAYKKLGEQQRVKVAFQHYLKFFPDELIAKKGLLECLAAEKDVAGALALLDDFEQDFIQSGAASDLIEIYQELSVIDPINVIVLEGLKRVYEAAGDKEGIEALEPKLLSLGVFSLKKSIEESPETPPEQLRQPESFNDRTVPPDSQEVVEPAATKLAEESLHALDEVFSLEESDAFTDVINPVLPADDDIEIEIEYDDDIGFDDIGTSGPSDNLGDNWLDSVGEMFDTIATSPRGVKFGIDLDLSDAQSHYDLGVAFKEMGLYDDAINEFSQAASDPARSFECRVLQGVCLREKGDPAKAEVFLHTLINPGLSLDDSSSIKYELALTCQVLGKNDEAATLFAEINIANPGFRDVSSRLDAAGIDSSLDFSDEDLQGFDLK